MIDKQNRLKKLLRGCKTLEEFIAEAVSRSSWVLAPYVASGHNVNRPWIENFWKLHKGVK